MQLSCYGIFAIVAAACESVASKDGIQHLSIEHSTRHKTDTDGISRSYDGKRNKLHVLTNETICASQQVESEIKTSSATADLNASNLLQIIGFFSRSMYRLPVFGVMFSCAFGQKISGHATTSRNLKLDLSFREGLYALSIYLAMGVIAYSFVLENWSVIDSLYFTCTCFTTGEYRILSGAKYLKLAQSFCLTMKVPVGYGDLCPSNAVSKLFTCVFGMAGIALLGASTAAVHGKILEITIESLDKIKRDISRITVSLFGLVHQIVYLCRLQRGQQKEQLLDETVLYQHLHRKILENCYQRFKPWHSSIDKILSSLIIRSIPSFVVMILGGTIMQILNGRVWSFGDSVYYSLVTGAYLSIPFAPHVYVITYK
jgi:hypothetical protein